MTQNMFKAHQNVTLKYGVCNTNSESSLLPSNSYPTMKN